MLRPVVLWLVRGFFFPTAEERVLLESELKIATRLTAASEGGLTWLRRHAPCRHADSALADCAALSGWLAGALLLWLIRARAHGTGNFPRSSIRRIKLTKLHERENEIADVDEIATKCTKIGRKSPTGIIEKMDEREPLN